MNRYAAALAPLLARFEQSRRPEGVGLIDCPEPDEAAAALAEGLGASCAPLTIELIDTLEGAGVARLPADDAVLERLNGQRDRLRLRKVLLVVVLTLDEQPRFQRLCGDIYSAPACHEILPFTTRTDVSFEEGRAQLLADHRLRLQKLDLRGFIRREQEDVSWTLHDVFVMPVARRQGRSSAEPLDALLAAAGEAASHSHDGGRGRPPPPAASAPDRRPRAPALREPRLVMGEPGGGKSFFLRWCALHDGPLFGRSSAMPVLVSLAAFAQAPQPRSLWQYAIDRLLDRTPLAAHALTAAAEAGRVVFLLDGLDEVEGEHAPARVRQEIERLQARAPRCLVIVTARPTVRDTRWPTFELQPLGPDAVRTFLAGWCAMYAAEVGGPEHREAGRLEGEALTEHVLAHDRLRQLSGNPLMLTILAIVNRRGLRLPDHRVELYQQISEVLVEKWNRLRALEPQSVASRPLSLADALRILGPVALELVETGHRGDFEAQHLRRQIERVQAAGKLTHLGAPDALVRLFRDTLGLIVEHAPGQYRFLHSMLLEFFAAHELVRTNTLERWAEDPQAVADQHQRHEPFLLALGILSQLRAEDERVEAVLERVMRWLENPSVEQFFDNQNPTFFALDLFCEDYLPGDVRDQVAEAIALSWFPGGHVPDVMFPDFIRKPAFADIWMSFRAALSNPQSFRDGGHVLAMSAIIGLQMQLDVRPVVRFGVLHHEETFLGTFASWGFEAYVPELHDYWMSGGSGPPPRTDPMGDFFGVLRELGFRELVEASGTGQTKRHALDGVPKLLRWEVHAPTQLSLEPPPEQILT